MLCASSLAWAEPPASRPATAPVDAASVQRMIRAMQQQIAELKDENQKLRTELTKTKSELAKLKPAAGAAMATISIGMSRVDAMATCAANHWFFDSDSSERAVGGQVVVTEVWTTQRPKAAGGDFRARERPQNAETGGPKDDAKPGQPQKVVFRDGVVVEIVR